MNQTQLIITSFDKTPLIEISIWIFLSISVLGVIARVATKLAVLRKLDIEDYLICTALLFAVGQSIAVAIQCAHGFGKHFGTLSPEAERAMLKAEYASDILFISSLSCTKISIVAFMITLTPIPKYRRSSSLLGLVIVLWAISSIFAVSFQCDLSSTWDYIHNSCFNRLHFWNSFAALNIITDLSTVFIITSIAYGILTSWSRKLALIGVFGTRILVVVAVGCQLFYSNKPVNDPAFDPWPTSISTQAVQCLSITTACLPYLKPFLNSLESGLLRTDDLRRRGGTGFDGYTSNYVDKSDETKFGGFIPTKINSNKSRFIKVLDSVLSITQQDMGDQELTMMSNTNLQLRPDPTGVVTIEGEGTEWEHQSQSSQTRIIKETRTWDIDVQGAAAAEAMRK